MILKFVMMVFVVLSIGCTHVGKNDAVEVVEPSKAISNLVQETPEVKTKQVQPSQLDAALLYSLLGGEVAGQRGEVKMAPCF